MSKLDQDALEKAARAAWPGTWERLPSYFGETHTIEQRRGWMEVNKKACIRTAEQIIRTYLAALTPEDRG